ncbi:MAG: hypothetical protein ACE5D2_00095 [Fidelibacterota bacterium]
MIAYLSGAMEFAQQEGANWRESLTQWLRTELGHSVYNPVLESGNLAEEYNAHDYRSWKYSQPGKYAEFIRNCVTRDLEMVQSVDYIICLWNEGVFKGAGTAGEVTMGYDSGKPIYLVNQLPPEDLSGWIMACSTEIFGDFDSLKSFLKRCYRKPGN